MGCNFMTLPGGGTVIVCGPRGRSSPCQVEGCSKPHTVLCDGNVGIRKTCDMRLCNDHRAHVGPDRDLCPNHTQQTDLGL